MWANSLKMIITLVIVDDEDDDVGRISSTEEKNKTN